MELCPTIELYLVRFLRGIVLIGIVCGACVPPSVIGKERTKKALEGRVEDTDKIRLERPVGGIVNQSVEILDGQSPGGYLDGTVDSASLPAGTAQDTMRGLVGSGDFSLKYKPKAPQTDPGSMKEWQADMETQKWNWESVHYTLPRYEGPCSNCLPPLPEYRLKKHYGSSDDWRLRQSELSGQVSFPQAGAQLFPQETFELPKYKIPRRFNATNALPGGMNLSPPIEERYVAWDDWYKRVADTLWRTWRAKGSASGEADLRITVTNGRTISADIINVTNRTPAFRNSLTQAVQSLNGSAELTFPSQSRRPSVTFQSHFSAGSDITAGATSKRSNDTERIRVRR